MAPQAARRRRRQAPVREIIYDTIRVRFPEPIYDTIHVRLPEPMVRPMVQQGVPIDHPEVETPSGVPKAGEKLTRLSHVQRDDPDVEGPSAVCGEGLGVPIDHPEVETPSGVTEAGQKVDHNITCTERRA